jgi:hypothetical protein
MKILLTDIVSDTYSNASGYKLYVALKGKLDLNERIELSFSGASLTSTSFLNSSFGSLIEELGLNVFLGLVRPAEVTQTQAAMLRHYIQGFRTEANA